MTTISRVRCAIYTRKSSEEGLEQSFNSLHAQREACEAYILSQKHEGWQLLSAAYDDGGFSGGSMQRPALNRLLEDVAAKKIDTVVVYKVDRLTRLLTDFAKIVEQFDKQGISFVSVTQQFNTTTSMGRLTLNVLLSFSQFEREVTGERIRDKIAASKRKGMWMGGVVPIGYDLRDRHLVVNPIEAERVREIYRLYLELGCVSQLQAHLENSGVRSKVRTSQAGRTSGGVVYSRGALYDMLQNRIYLGEITHKEASFPGQHDAILDRELWDQVQARFLENLQAPSRKLRVTRRSLLMGILYDQNGNRFTPSHAIKNGKRYRYYVSQAVIRGVKKQSGPVRLPAEEIEQLVVTQLRLFLQSPQRLLDILANVARGTIESQSIMTVSQEWVTATPHELQNALRSILVRVNVRQEKVELQLNKSALVDMFIGPECNDRPTALSNDADDLITIEAEAQVKRCRGEIRFLLSPDAHPGKPKSVPSLVRAVARAHDWMDRITRGELKNQRALAQHFGLNERYVSKIISLAFLSPYITEAILEGIQPPHLSLDSCMRHIPLEWSQQQSLFTLSGSSRP